MTDTDVTLRDLIFARRWAWLKLEKEFVRRTGDEAISPVRNPVEFKITQTSSVRLFIIHDPSRVKGYRLISAYPKNQVIAY